MDWTIATFMAKEEDKIEIKVKPDVYEGEYCQSNQQDSDLVNNQIDNRAAKEG